MFDQSFHVLKQDLPSALKYEDVIFVFEDIDAEAPKIVRKRATTNTNHHRPQALATANQVANRCLCKEGGKAGGVMIYMKMSLRSFEVQLAVSNHIRECQTAY